MKDIEQYKNRFYNLMESTMGDAKPLINEQIISESAEQLLMNKSGQLNTSIGIAKNKLNQCFKYSINNNSPSSFGVGGNEIEHYVDYLNIYGKVPGTSIPIPYEGDDLQQMIYLLQGSGVARNISVYGSVEQRTTNQNDVIYPAVEAIRAYYNSETGDSLYEDLGKKTTDSDEDLQLKNRIKGILINAYQVWIDCANGKRTSTYK